MVRTLFVIAIIFVGGIASLTSSFHALLFYLWIAYFRPEFWVWDNGFLQGLQLSLVAGVWTIVATVVYGAKPQFNVRTLLLVLMLAASTVSTFSSPYINYATGYWQDFAKVIVITYLISILVNDEARLRLTLAVISLSIGLEAAKQGLVQLLLNPGAKNFNSTGAFGDENLTAVGMFMIAPMLLVLGQTSRVRWHAWIWRLLALGVFYRGISTYSRGGFLACGAMLVVYIWRSPHRVRSFAAIALLAVLIVPILPTAYWDRMNTIKATDEERDASAEGRVHFWEVAMRMANAYPLTGIGHNAFNAAYDKYDFSNGQYGERRSVHSSWFGVVSELGYPGLLTFVLSILSALLSCRRARKLAARLPDSPHLARYSLALECALAAFVVGGSFVIFQYAELLWHVLGLTMALEAIVRARIAEQTAAHVEVTPALAVA
jgi:probable O-glycosylation ligase (exosortase A-associated)